MSKSILTIGLGLASPDTKYESFRSRVSLLDWDIILFRPLINEFWGAYVDNYQGKPSLDDSSSFQLKDACEHWRREIKQAVETGKTVIVYLPAVSEVYIDTGERRYSGTGRNQKTTRIVAPYTNYAAIPAELRPVNATGTAMKLAPLGAEVLAPYWSEFSAVSEYKVLLTVESIRPCIATKNGDKAVATLLRSKTSSGSLVLLPDVDFYPDAFFKQQAKEQVWTPAAKQFAAKLVGCVVALDKALHASADVTPEPDWANEHRFSLQPERQLRAQLLEVERHVEEAQRKLEETQTALHTAGQLRALLYEKGKPLEAAIVDALIKLGFSAAPYKDTQSEFDVVFQCAEGRLLGEAEGKDTKAINVDKLRQLAMNIHEDLQREEVSKPAKGVLFGNGYRLSRPQEREPQFTDKCISAALSSSTALLSTSELFRVTQHHVENPNEAFAFACREAILKGVGLVTLPETQAAEQPSSEAADV
jgi:hypothetical protein